jgi:YjbE family integral membrane protein
MPELTLGPHFWIGLGEIMLVNIILSGDNAVVIALAARSLPEHQRKLAVVWGSVAAVIMRVILTIAAVEMLRLPYLKLVGSALLFWIAVKLLAPEEDGGDGMESRADLIGAIRTILIADLVMSLDNVLAVAAAAKGDTVLLMLGLGISIPLVIFGSTIILKLMDRFPVIVTLGAALLGFVAGEMLITDPVVASWPAFSESDGLHWIIPAAGAVLVIVVGKGLAERRKAVLPAPAELVDLAEAEEDKPAEPGPR